MKSLFKRSSGSPSPPHPTTSPFPTMENNNDVRASVDLPSPFRHRSFSSSRDHNGNIPSTAISSPMQQTAKVIVTDPLHYSRKRLQSGGIAFDEVLPSFISNSSSAPPIPSPPASSACIQPYALARPPPAIHTSRNLSSSSVAPSQMFIETAQLSARELAADTPLASPAAHEQDIPTTPTRPRRSSVRRLRGTNEFGTLPPHIDALISPTVGSYQKYVNHAPRPQLAGRRAASMSEVQFRANQEQLGAVGYRPQILQQSLSAAPAMSHSRVRSDQVRDAASTHLLDAAEITLRPRATSTSVVGKQSPRSRRPTLARAIHMHSENSYRSQNVLHGSEVFNSPATTASMLNVETHSTHGTTTTSSSSPTSTTTPSTGPLEVILSESVIRESHLNASLPRGLLTPGSRTPSEPYSPSNLLYANSTESRDTAGKVPFPKDVRFPRTTLTPPENPQMSAALQVDATRISLDKYDITQDLTFVLRVQNIVADDVEVELVTTVESSETVFELKIKKKDPNGMRVRNGIIPYTYVPPFASPSSTSSPSSVYSSPVTTPTLEVPYGHHHGSYFPMGAGRSPRRNSLVSRPAASARSSHMMLRTPNGHQGQPLAITIKNTGGISPGLSMPAHLMTAVNVNITPTGAISPISPTFPNGGSGTPMANDSGDDDDEDNGTASVLAHYITRDSHAPHSMSRLTAARVDRRGSADHGKSVFNSNDDDNVQEGEDESSDHDSTFPFGMKSYWSDTEAEAGTGDDGEDESPAHSSDSMSGDSSPTGPDTP